VCHPSTDRIRTRTAVDLVTALAALMIIAAPAGSAAAYEFPSTNDANRATGLPHVNEVEKGPGTVTLEFVKTRRTCWCSSSIASMAPRPVRCPMKW
jgi:hypothetical protein